MMRWGGLYRLWVCGIWGMVLLVAIWWSVLYEGTLLVLILLSGRDGMWISNSVEDNIKMMGFDD